MTIKQALKLKNRLVGEITDTQIKMMRYNSVSESNQRPYSTKALLEQQYNLVKNHQKLMKIKLTSNCVVN